LRADFCFAISICDCSLITALSAGIAETSLMKLWTFDAKTAGGQQLSGGRLESFTSPVIDGEAAALISAIGHGVGSR
jgi:hypothetical protein